MKRKRGNAADNLAQNESPNSPAKSRLPSDDDSEEAQETPVRNADRSARRKTAQRIVRRAVADASSNEDPDRGGAELEAHIWDDEDGEEEVEESDDGAEVSLMPETPSKKKRGRPRKDREKEESPPSVNMPPHERYFWDNRPGAGKTSNSVFAPGTLLDHDRYFEQRDLYQDRHENEQRFLLELHESAFEQWVFEMRNDFNICLYGYGSKTALVRSFAEFVHDILAPHPSIVIVNGYAANLSLVEILTTVASTLFPAHIKLPSTVATLLPLILETLTKKAPKQPVHLLINSIDAPPMRKAVTQSTLATLAAHPSLRLLATADSPNFPLLWDAPLRSRFRFLFHDCTTFVPLDAEVTDAVDAVATLLGKKSSRIGGKDGISFVLRSLPENARHLFRILVAEQVAAGIGAAEGGNIPDSSSSANAGVEYRVLYHKAREELVCSTEHQLRTLLKEFYDHQMVESRRDALGTERLVVPFKQEELESLLEDLVE